MSCLSPFFDDIPLTDSRQATISHKGFLFSNFAANLSRQIIVKAFMKKAFLANFSLSFCKKSTVYEPAFAQFISNQMTYEWFMSCFAEHSNICVKV